MISRSTVLVLGAGSAMPYGFPSGRRLKSLIVEDAVSPSVNGISQLVAHAAYDMAAFREFADALRKSGRGSVDEFLEFRPEYLEVGKAAIAAALIPLEDERALFPLEHKPDDLYQYLFAQMRADRDSWTDNAVSIITFNYDRSLEHYFCTAFSNAFGVSYAEAGRAVVKIPIIHVYGQLGELPALTGKGRSYDSDAAPDKLRLAASGIMILSEHSRMSAPALQQAKEAMAVAERIYFLGFGYHPTNLRRLEVRSIRQHISLFGTTNGFTDSELNDIKGRFAQGLSLDPLKGDTVMFLRTLQPLGSVA